MNILCFGQENWERGWTGKQQLLTRLAERGHRILYVDPAGRPRGTAPAAGPAVARLPGLPDVRDLGPGALWVWTDSSRLRCASERSRARRGRRLAKVARLLLLVDPVAVALRPDVDLLDAVAPALRVYHPFDVWSGFAGPDDAARARLRAAEDVLLGRVDLAVGVSAAQVERFRAAGADAHLLSAGAELDRWTPARLVGARPDPALAVLARPRAGYVGPVDERLDVALLRSLATARPDVAIVLVGRSAPGFDVAPLAAIPHVHLAGPRADEDLPGVLRTLDMVLLPCRGGVTPWPGSTAAVQALAAGLPVVATPGAGLEPCAGAVAVAAGGHFVAAVTAALADPAAGRDARPAAARVQSWDRHAAELEALLEQRLAARRPPVAAPAGLQDVGKPSAGRPAGARLRRLAVEGTRLAGALAARFRLRRPRAAAAPHTILVAHAPFLGDLIVLLPCLEALRREFPAARLVLGVHPGAPAAELQAAAGLIDEVRTLDVLQAATCRARLAGLLRLVREGFDMVVGDLDGSPLPEPWRAGARVRMGLLRRRRSRRLLAGVLPVDPRRHEADANVDRVEALSGRRYHGPRAPRLRLDPERVTAAGVALEARLGGPLPERLVLLHPGGQTRSRRWPLERFAALTERLLASDARLGVAITGDAGERPLGEAIRARLVPGAAERLWNAAGATDLPALVALLQGSAAVVASDLTVIHLARALGTPLVALLGPENERRWGPHPLGPGPAVSLRREVPCAPCSRPSCAEQYCMRGLDVEEVFAACLDVLAAGRRSAGFLAPLERRTVRLDFAELAARGFTIPRVSILRLAAAPAGEAGQTYPACETIVANGAPLRAILGAAGGDLLAPSVPGRPWPPELLATHVAALLREPAAPFAYSPRLTPRGVRERLGRATLRRSFLEMALDQDRTGLAGTPGPGARERLLARLLRDPRGLPVDTPVAGVRAATGLSRDAVGSAEPGPWW